jgi:multicomponent Na+:H+ antiporter subunit E
MRFYKTLRRKLMPILYLIFWIVLNSRLTLEVLLLGVFVSALLSVFTYKIIGISFRKELEVWKIFGKHVFVYGGMLIGGMIMSNLQMIKIILSKDQGDKPRITYFETPVKTNFAKIVLMYTIMLTPGTVAFEAEEERFGIHAINEKMGKDIEKSKFVEKLKKIEGSD